MQIPRTVGVGLSKAVVSLQEIAHLDKRGAADFVNEGAPQLLAQAAEKRNTLPTPFTASKPFRLHTALVHQHVPFIELVGVRQLTRATTWLHEITSPLHW